MMNSIKRVFYPSEFTGWHMAGVMCLFFGTIISVNMFLAFSASSTWTGLVVKNTYVESQHFNERTAEYNRQGALGWHAEPSYENGEFSIQLQDSVGNAIRGASVVAKLGRPVHEGDDRELVLTSATPGTYAGATQLSAGVWDAELTVNGANGNKWNRIVRFTLKD